MYLENRLNAILGLTIVKQIVYLHGGNISVESKIDPPQCDSCFIVSLPVNV
jgi:signal transduction histidine kinase